MYEHVQLRLALEFDCPACGKLSFASYVPNKPPAESEENGIKIEAFAFIPPKDVICRHCGAELPTTEQFHSSYEPNADSTISMLLRAPAGYIPLEVRDALSEITPDLADADKSRMLKDIVTRCTDEGLWDEYATAGLQRLIDVLDIDLSDSILLDVALRELKLSKAQLTRNIKHGRGNH